MARWTDLAKRQESTHNQGGPMVEHRGLVIHIAEGYYEGTISYQQGSVEVSSHFVCSNGAAGQGVDGELCQMIDTDVTAWTQQAGNGHWLSVECAGFTPHPLTAAQCESVAQLLARMHRDYGVPLQIATNPNGRGLGHHSMGTNGHSVPTDTWTGPTWGHEDCPGPAIVAQKESIVARAAAIVNGGNVTQPDPGPQVWDDKLGRNAETLDPATISYPVSATGQLSLPDERNLAAGTLLGSAQRYASAATRYAMANWQLLQAIKAALAPNGGQPFTDAQLEQLRTVVRAEIDKTHLTGPAAS